MMRNFKDELSLIWLVAWRELRDQLRDWRIILPMIVLTLVLPFLADLGAQAAINFTTKYGTPLIAERLVPFLLMVVGYFPITISLVIALESFVGEKERGTIEPLLSSPAQRLAALYGQAAGRDNCTAFYLLPGHHGIPDRSAFSAHSLPGCEPDGPNADPDRGPGFPDGGRRHPHLDPGHFSTGFQPDGFIYRHPDGDRSSRAKVSCCFGEMTRSSGWLWRACPSWRCLLARVGIAHFQREALLGREIDVLNLRWIVQTFWRAFKGNARSIPAWFQLRSPRYGAKTGSIHLDDRRPRACATVGGYIWVTMNTTRSSRHSNPVTCRAY